MSRIQYWTSKINNIVKEICNIKSTFKNHKNNQSRPDKYGEDEMGNKYSSDNNLICHDQTSNHDTPTHHDPPPIHNDQDTFPTDPPNHQDHSYPDIVESGTEPTSSYGFPSLKACITDMVMKPLISPSDPSSRMYGSYEPSEEGVIGSSGGGELLDPDDGEVTIKPLRTLRREGIGDENKEVRGEHWGEGRIGEERPSTLPAQWEQGRGICSCN